MHYASMYNQTQSKWRVKKIENIALKEKQATVTE